MEKTSVYWRLIANINPLIIGPTVCPTSIIMSRKPMAVPTNSLGVSSLINAGVAAVTVAKPIP